MVATLLVVSLAAAACGGGSGGGATSEPLPEVAVPSPPDPAPQPQGTPEQRAVALAELVDPDNGDPLPGWRTVYDALGVPMIGPDGAPLGVAGEVPLGPEWWRVWSSTRVANPDLGVGIVDLGAVLAPDETGARRDGAAYGAALLDDLRADIESGDEARQLFGQFIRERVRRGPSGVDLVDPAVGAEQVSLDGATLNLVTWVALRGVMETAASAGAGGRAPTAPTAPLSGSAKQNPCAEFGIDFTSDIGKLFASAIKLALAGVTLPGGTTVMQGMIQVVVEDMKGWEDPGVAAKDFHKNVRYAADILSLMMLLMSLRVDATNEEVLERTKTTTDGKKTRTDWRLMADPSETLDGNGPFGCIVNTIAGFAGVKLQMPKSGRIKGAEMVFTGVDGFQGRGERVLFADYGQLKQDTNEHGEVRLDILGRAQKKKLPDDAEQIDEEYSIQVSAQPQEETVGSIGDMFYDSLDFGLKMSAQKLIKPLIDLIRVMHWDFGTYVFPMKDWQSCGPGRAVGTDPSQEVCRASSTISYHWVETYVSTTGLSRKTVDYTITIDAKVDVNEFGIGNDIGSTYRIAGSDIETAPAGNCAGQNYTYSGQGKFLDRPPDFFSFVVYDDGFATLDSSVVATIEGTRDDFGDGGCVSVPYEGFTNVLLHCPLSQDHLVEGSYDESSRTADFSCTDSVSYEDQDIKGTKTVTVTGAITLP